VIVQYPDLVTGPAARGCRGSVGRLLDRGLRVTVSGGAIARGAVASRITTISTITRWWISSVSLPTIIVIVVIAAVSVAAHPLRGVHHIHGVEAGCTGGNGQKCTANPSCY